jgi:ABC-type polysaccharide/polyol phosphate export permease
MLSCGSLNLITFMRQDPVKQFINYLRDLWKRKSLLLYLVTSGLKADTRNTFLGYFWWVLDPLLLVVVYYFLRIVLMGRSGEHVIAFLATGLIVFQNFARTLTGSAGSITGKASIITQVYLPKAIFPFSVVLTQLINFAFGLVVIAVVLLFSGIVPGAELAWLPLVMLVQTVFHLALALFLGYLCAFVRDLGNLLSYVTRVLRYTSPVIWEVSRLPEIGRASCRERV